MSTLSWKPINFDRWLCLAEACRDADPAGATNLATAVERMRLAWNRLCTDLGELFLPSGPAGTHAHHHYHAPADPDVRERVLNACTIDYETFLIYLEVGLQLSTRCVAAFGVLPMKNWSTLATAAERGDGGLATDAQATILYLHRVALHVRHKGIVHPKDHLAAVSFDNVGNLTFWRLPLEPDPALVSELDRLLHEVRPDIREDAKVGSTLAVQLALTWIGSVVHRVEDLQRLEKLRDALGYTFPGPYEVAPAVDAMVDAFIQALPESDFGRVAFAAGPTSSRIATPQADAAAAAAQHDPTMVERLFEEATSAGELGDHATAATKFSRVLELDPENGDARLNLAEALLQLNEPEAAIDHLVAATAIGISAAEVGDRLVRAYFNAAAAAYNRGALATAVANYRRVCELAPSDVEARRRLAVTLARDGHLDAALMEAARVNRVAAEDADAQCDIGMVALLAGQVDLAGRHLHRALDLRPGWKLPAELLQQSG
ncbi:MAG TPA: tetratricopeptide repeat protein [Candidatus Dormibacteraeota bacterium]|nr:tetratricopeptide repeat protein [Candidatus Dormibacteraeota bacterium]